MDFKFGIMLSEVVKFLAKRNVFIAVGVEQGRGDRLARVIELFENRSDGCNADAPGNEHVVRRQVFDDKVAIKVGHLDGVAGFQILEGQLEGAALLLHEAGGEHDGFFRWSGSNGEPAIRATVIRRFVVQDKVQKLPGFPDEGGGGLKDLGHYAGAFGLLGLE